MTITSRLRFLYIFWESGLLCAATQPQHAKKKTCCKNAEKTLILDGPLLVEMVAILLVGPFALVDANLIV